MGEKDAVVSKQQLSDEFLDGFRACEETPKVAETAVCSETDVDAVWQVLFCLTEHDAEEDGVLQFMAMLVLIMKPALERRRSSCSSQPRRRYNLRAAISMCRAKFPGHEC